MRSCKGMISSSQAITTTARNSRPLARCIVLIETCPLAVSTCSSRILKRTPAAFTAARARSSCAARPDKHAEFVRHHARFRAFGNPIADKRRFLALALERANLGRRAVENGNRIAPILAVAIHVGHDRAQKAVRLRADLMGSAIIDAQGARASADIDAQSLPRERLLEDALPEIAGEKERVGATSPQGGKEPDMGDADILRLVHDREIEDGLLGFRYRGGQ